MKKLLMATIALLMLTGCGGKKNDREDREAAYAGMLTDSIAKIEREIDSCENRLKEVHDQIGVWLRDFTNVSNPREAGSYLIYTSFKDKYPLKTTGIASRINSNGQFELIAALKNTPFTRIAAIAPSETAETLDVPRDQALNYTADGLTTVLFTGKEAVEVGRVIADNQLNHVTINYLNSGPVLGWVVPNETAKMMMATYILYRDQQEAARLEQRIPMLHEKINLLRAHRDRRTSEAPEQNQ